MFTCVNITKIKQKYGNRLIDVAYMLSGEIAQIICLLVTKYGMFCRPIKNIQEDKIEDLIGADNTMERITYGMLIGNANIEQHKLEINVLGGNENG